MMKPGKQSQQGAVLAMMLVILVLLMILTNVVITRYLSELSMGNQSYRKYQSLNIAEAGIQKAIYELNRTSGNYQGEKNTGFSNGKFSIEIHPSPSANYQVRVTGIALLQSRYIQKTVIVTELRKSNGSWKIVSWKEL